MPEEPILSALCLTLPRATSSVSSRPRLRSSLSLPSPAYLLITAAIIRPARHESHSHAPTPTHTPTHTHTAHAHARLLPGTQCPRSRPRITKQSGRGSCHLELNPAEPHAESIGYTRTTSILKSPSPSPLPSVIVTVTVAFARAHVSTAGSQHALARQSESAVPSVQRRWYPRVLSLARCRLRSRQCEDAE